jgi:hypothetical protein
METFFLGGVLDSGILGIDDKCHGEISMCIDTAKLLCGRSLTARVRQRREQCLVITRAVDVAQLVGLGKPAQGAAF